jgi:hypothetical protein
MLCELAYMQVEKEFYEEKNGCLGTIMFWPSNQVPGQIC